MMREKSAFVSIAKKTDMIHLVYTDTVSTYTVSTGTVSTGTVSTGTVSTGTVSTFNKPE